MSTTTRRASGRLAAALAVAAIAAFTTPQAQASVTDLGTIDANTSSPFWGVSTNTASTEYEYTFTVASTSTSSIDAVASPIGGPGGQSAFSSFQMNLYSNGSKLGTLLGSTSSSLSPAPPLHQYLSVANLGAGTYLLDIVATATGAHHAFAGTVSAIPLPAALPLFGAALLGMGYFSRRRARKDVTAA